MAAPAAALYTSYVFRDAKGQTAKLRTIIGDTTLAAVTTDQVSLKALLVAVSNATVRLVSQDHPSVSYGAASVYQDVEDKAQLVFTDTLGYMHRYQIPAPKAAGFDTDGETVLASETNMAALITALTTYTYGRTSDTAPLVYIGGIRIRRRFQRKFNIITKNPAETGPGE
jgi:hypothetical protein